MNKILIVASIAILVIIGGFALASGSEDRDDSVSGTDTTPPDVNDLSKGHTVVIKETSSYITVKAIPEKGRTFDGWFKGDVLVSEKMIDTFPASDIGSMNAIFGDGGMKSKEYEWMMPVFATDGTPSGLEKHMTFTVSLDSADYWTSIIDEGLLRHATYALPMPVFMLEDSDAVDQIVDYLNDITEGMTNLQKATILACFVQDVIKYDSDSNQYGKTEFWTTVSETIFSGRGDCEDTATMFVNIGARMGLDVGFVAFESPTMGHMSAAVALKDGEIVDGNAVFDVDGIRYAYVETAIDGSHSPVGHLVSSYRITNGIWTHVIYDDDTNTYNGSETVPIGTGTITGSPMIYG